MTLRYVRRCARCGAFLDPHEPVVVVVRDMGTGRTWPAALAQLSGEDVALFHEGCPPALEASPRMDQPNKTPRSLSNGRPEASAGIES
jgi:hypothetical protein